MNKEEAVLKIVRQLEWAHLVYSEAGQGSIFCCPLCGGVRPDVYGKYYKEFCDDTRYHRGHFKDCLYNAVKLVF